MLEFLRSLGVAASKHPLPLIGNAFVAFSVLWTITEATYHFSEWSFLKSSMWVATALALSCIYSSYVGRQLRNITIRLLRNTVAVEVVTGDIFSLDGTTVITVSEYFESEIGQPVSPTSLHGIFIKRCFGGHPQAFDEQVTRGSDGIRPVQVRKHVGKTARYPIGSTVPLTANDKQFLAFALTRADPKTCKASADVPQMFEALAGLWKKAREHLNGNSLNVPLIGSGVSGVGWPTQVLVYMIILSFLDASRRQLVSKHLRIVLTPDKMAELDLRHLRDAWEE